MITETSPPPPPLFPLPPALTKSYTFLSNGTVRPVLSVVYHTGPTVSYCPNWPVLPKLARTAQTGPCCPPRGSIGRASDTQLQRAPVRDASALNILEPTEGVVCGKGSGCSQMKGSGVDRALLHGYV